MASATYHGTFRNPTEGWRVGQNSEGLWFIEVPERCECGSECCDRRITGYRPHSNNKTWEESDDAYEWIDNVAEKAEEDYDRYLEENHHEIAQMEAYEQFRNEY